MTYVNRYFIKRISVLQNNQTYRDLFESQICIKQWKQVHQEIRLTHLPQRGRDLKK